MAINKITINASLQNLLGNDQSFATPQEAVLHVKNDRSFIHGVEVILPFDKTKVFDGSGNASITIIETETVGEKLEFFIVYSDGRSKKVIWFEPSVVPNTTPIELTQITSVIDQDFG